MQRGLAHKLAIRLSGRFTSAALLEINAHSLFSKWFSESGKLVQQLFGVIQEMVEEEDAFVAVLIDEVESLSAARKAAMAGNEPSDSIRAVNALLTQIDALKRYPNVLVLTTSNITGAIDLAFVDRADIKQYIPLPSYRARFQILHSCLAELVRRGIVEPGGGDDRATTSIASCSTPGTAESESVGSSDSLLAEAALRAEGLSGRALRKLPFQAHAFYIHKPRCSMRQFLHALLRAVHRELSCREALEECDGKSK